MDLTGKKLGPFHIEGRLGEGAMGTVYRGRHESTGKWAAVKVMSAPGDEASPTLAARFEREIKLLSQFRHPNIVRIYGASEDQGIRYYAMELVEGETLAERIERQGRLPFPKVIAYGVQICEALQQIHAVGVVHRDLKPGNLMISADHRVKLTDFGIAKDTSALNTKELTRADHTVGTVLYMSPEQLAGGELTRKSDLYSLGVVFYRMLTGRLPFNGETVYEYMQQRMRGTYPPVTSFDTNTPLEFDLLIRDLLAEDPAQRPMDAYVVMQRLMDIGKKSKGGTLAKTKTATTQGMAETVAIRRFPLATVVQTLAGTFIRPIAGKKKKRRHEGGPFWESPVFLGAALAILLGTLGYVFLWPKGPASLKAQADRLLTSPNYVDWQKALDAYLVPIQRDHPAFAKDNAIDSLIADTEVQIAKAKARGIANQALRFNIRRDDASEAERKVIDALVLKETYGDRGTSQERLRAAIDLFKSDPAAIGWVKLAEDELASATNFASDAERVAAKRKTVSAAIAKAEELKKKGKRAESVQMLVSLERLYADDADVEDLVREANLEFYTPAELYEKGAELMDGPLDSKRRAFALFFEPLLKKFPGDANAAKIEKHREELQAAEAQVAIEANLSHGVSAEAPPLEAKATLALFLSEKLGDRPSASQILATVAATKDAKGVNIGYVRYAEAWLTDHPLSDESLSESARRAAAQEALAGLAKLDAANPVIGGFRKKVLDYYRSQPALRDLVREE